jgi:hypothetical protein
MVAYVVLQPGLGTNQVASGSGNPTIDVTITWNSKRVEKTLMAKFKDGYVAKREHDPAFYRLNWRVPAFQKGEKCWIGCACPH